MKDFNKTLNAHKTGIKFQQVFFCKKSYLETIRTLRKLGFIIDGEMSH